MNINLDQLLEEYRAVTPRMTHEKYEYLKANQWLSPVKAVRLAILKRNGANDELLARAEYSYLFESYANSFEKSWQQYGDGLGLGEYAEGALEQSILAQQNQNSGHVR